MVTSGAAAARGGLGFSTEEQRIEVLAWLLQDRGNRVDINQREYEFLWMSGLLEGTFDGNSAALCG